MEKFIRVFAVIYGIALLTYGVVKFIAPEKVPFESPFLVLLAGVLIIAINAKVWARKSGPQ